MSSFIEQEKEVVYEGWFCQNPKCRRQYAEYVNGCPACEVDELDAPDGKMFVAKVRFERVTL